MRKGKSYELNILKEGLDRIYATLITPALKLSIYKHYLFPSKRFLLTVHTLTKSHLSLLDTTTDLYTKKWAGLPNCATNSILHMKESLQIRAISSLYIESHAAS